MSGPWRRRAQFGESGAARLVERAGLCVPLGMAASFAGGMTIAAAIVLGLIFIGPFPGTGQFLITLIALPWVLGFAGLFFGGPGAIVLAGLLAPLLRRKRFSGWACSVAAGALAAMPATALSLQFWHLLGVGHAGAVWPGTWQHAFAASLWLAPSGAAGGAVAWWILGALPDRRIAAYPPGAGRIAV